MSKENNLFVAKDIEKLYDCFTKEQIGDSRVVSTSNLLEDSEEFQNVEFLFSTWGAPALNAEQITAILPNLKAIFYAAGTVKGFARPFLEAGVKVFSAWKANAVPVAEVTVANILLANKGFFIRNLQYKNYNNRNQLAHSFPGNYNTKVGLIGAGEIGKKVIELLKPYKLEIYVYDKFLSEEAIELLGAKKASLSFIFEQCQTISNHLANKEELRKFLNKDLFDKMLPNAAFINTGRGTQVDFDDLIQAMESHPYRCAILDVTDPLEPLPREHKAWKCENIIITPHIAGSIEQEIYRMGQLMMDEYSAYKQQKECNNEVTLGMLEHMA